MNAPHKPVGIAKPLRDVSVAVPTTPSKMKCPECEGKGEAEYLALDAVRPHWADCHHCGGSGEVAPYCQCGNDKLTPDLFCYDCEEYIDGAEPVGWERAERSAFGMAGRAA